MRASRIIVVSLGAGFLALIGYAIADGWPPTDLALTSVQIVNGNDPRLARDDIGQYGASDLFAIAQFRTTTNLKRFGHDETLFNDAYFCSMRNDANRPNKEGRVFDLSTALVYDSNGPVSDNPHPYQQAGRYSYHILIRLRQKQTGEFAYYDLVRSPQDVCFDVIPIFPFVGLWPPSNEVVIPRKVLAMAINRSRFAQARHSDAH